LSEQQTAVKKNHINGLCRRIGIDYRQETAKKTRWTKHHHVWLEARINKLEHTELKIIFKILLKQYKDITKNLELYDAEIEHAGELPKYQKKVTIPSAFKGVKTTTL
jgi:hypothetical protein